MTRNRRHWMILMFLAGFSATAFAATRLPAPRRGSVMAVTAVGVCAPVIEFVSEEFAGRRWARPEVLRPYHCRGFLD